MATIFRPLFVLLTLTLLTLAAGQSDDHDLRVEIPLYVGLKIVDAGGNLSTDPAVVFDYSGDPDLYQSAVVDGTPLSPTAVTDFEDVQVYTSRGPWWVFVRATPLSATPGATGLALNDFLVTRGAVSGLSADAIDASFFLNTIEPSWRLSTTWQRIARNFSGTRGWRSLGFNGEDYTVDVDGDETPGTFGTVVTYLLWLP